MTSKPQSPGHSASQRASGTTQRQRCPGDEDQPPEASEAPAREAMRATIDGNEAAVSVAYRLNEVCCIYPITPSSPMAELADQWTSERRPNV